VTRHATSRTTCRARFFTTRPRDLASQDIESAFQPTAVLLWGRRFYTAPMSSKSVDWCEVLYPGPRRAYTADEMTRGGSDAPSRTMMAMAGVNLAAVTFAVLQLAPVAQTAWLLAAILALAALGASAARWLWWRPWRRPLVQAQIGVTLMMLLLSLGIRWLIADVQARYAISLVLVIGCMLMVIGLWILVLWRSRQIEFRLREYSEREQAIEMARRLCAAQIEPHFLFNTLASVQHWVQTKDDRAAPLLAALTGYLRATLPLFNRALLPAGDELVAVQHYLKVMQARMGERLRWHCEVPNALEKTLLPPGLLLTLVENAVVHGIEPQLTGGNIKICATLHDNRAVFAVIDDGPGPPVDTDQGVGLNNIRKRLALTSAGAASLEVSVGPGGGCRAQITLPYSTEAAF
jgi:signal transduction histidine kinase